MPKVEFQPKKDWLPIVPRIIFTRCLHIYLYSLKTFYCTAQWDKYAFTDNYFPKLFNYISDLLNFSRGILLNIIYDADKGYFWLICLEQYPGVQRSVYLSIELDSF